MSNSQSFVIFSISDQRFALYLSAVERVIAAIEITPLPHAPEIISGIININGQIIPVADTRKRFNLPPREIDIDDHIIIARTNRRLVALIVDSVEDTALYNDLTVADAAEILPNLKYLAGVLKLNDGLVLIHDLEKFLSLDEEIALDRAINEAQYSQSEKREGAD